MEKIKGVSQSKLIQKKMNISSKSQIFHTKKLASLGLINISRSKDYPDYKYKMLELTDNGYKIKSILNFWLDDFCKFCENKKENPTHKE